MTDLWPDFDFDQKPFRTPKEILQEQAKALTDKTQNKIRGRVSHGLKGQVFTARFEIQAPNLGGYRYRVLQVEYGLAEVYPAALTPDSDIAAELSLPGETVEVADEKALNEWLAKVFASDKLQKVVYSLMQHF